MPGTPFISVVVATYNRQDLFERTLSALASQKWPRDRFEIVVADNGSKDGTRTVVETFQARDDSPPIRYLFVPEPGKSHAVNRALACVAGELIAFTDDDVIPDGAWLEQLAIAFEETRADFVAGKVKPLWQSPPPRWMSHALYGVLAVPDNGDRRFHFRPPQNSQAMPIGANMAVRREVVQRLGGFRVDLGKLDGTFRTGEDHEFFLRMHCAGCHGVYEPSALVHHWVPNERMQRSYVQKWLYQNGRDVARLEASYRAPMRRLFGVPRYLWRQGLGDAYRMIAATVRPDAAERFAAFARILWLGGYARESWR